MLIVVLLVGVGCQAYQQQQQAKQAMIQKGNGLLDSERVLITTGDLHDSYEKLGDLSYTEPLSSDSIDPTHINQKLRQMAIARWGRNVDALIRVNNKVGADATSVTVTAIAVEVKGNCSFCRHNHASPTMAPTSEMPVPD
jgi:hypothetical protein